MILLEMLSYPFLVRAFVVGVLVSLCAALLGASLVLKRFSMIGDGLSHVGFGALAIASALGVAPLAVAVPVVVVAAVLLLRVSQSGKVRGDAAVALISSGALAVGVLVISNGRVLSGTRHNDFGYGLVCGPGGHVEPGETPVQAAFRETEEEFGISPKELIPLGRGPLEPDTGLRPHLFLCTDYEGEPDCLDLEMSGAKFRTMQELAEYHFGNSGESSKEDGNMNGLYEFHHGKI